ncbi:MAG: NADPH:quinone reductase Zn-dependent oxidoreductase [Candidatus Saccharibacteria bacterium]|nr:NADPH:quinone reductase Zn-dependent oxidoreductase [Candidatus Saccharibacteria bacterium]
MKAAQIDNYGDVSAIEIREVEKPTITEEQVLIEVAAASLNPFDTSVRAGYAQSMAPLTFPATLGLDLTGTIVEVGANVTGFGVGEKVYGTANAMFGASGAFAEYTAANATSVAVAPKNISDTEIASLPTAGVSALQAVVDNIQLKSGQKIFINGGSGGVGSTAIQIAKHLGAYVAVAASADNRDFALSLGADEFIDYKTQNYKDVISDYDAVLNNVYGDNTIELLDVLKQGGVAVSMTGGFDDDKAASLGVKAINMGTMVTTSSLNELTKLVEDGIVTVAIDQTFTLDQIKEAFIARETESVKGKIAIKIA